MPLLSGVPDGFLELRDAVKDAAPYAFVSQIAEESLDHVEPRGTGGDEVQVKPRMPDQPALHFFRQSGGRC